MWKPRGTQTVLQAAVAGETLDKSTQNPSCFHIFLPLTDYHTTPPHTRIR